MARNMLKEAPKRLGTGWLAKHKKTLVLLTMVAPAAIWLLLLRYLPMGGIVLAFKDYKVNPRNPSFFSNLIHSKWVGWKNFRFIFKNNMAAIALRNTVLYNLAFIILGIIIPVAFAIMMNELTHKFVPKAYQTLMFFPYFLSWVVVSYFLYAFISSQYGLITAAQREAGEAVTNWYKNTGPWPYIIVLAKMWKDVGYTTMLYLSTITGIDSTQFEAAAIDGASKWQQILYVTIPNLRTMIAILFIMNIGKIFNADFGLFWNVPMNDGALLNVTEVVDTWIYRIFTTTNNIGQSTSVGLIQNVASFICIIAANGFVKKIDEDSSMF